MFTGLLSKFAIAVILYCVYRLAWWAWTTFGRKIDLKKYHGNDSWALITGSTDGIGLAFAHKLAQLDFNIILVGRNQEKLNKVKSELNAQSPNIKVKTVQSEASDLGAQNIENIGKAVDGLDLSILVNNVGVGQGGMKVLEELDSADILNAISVNCAYPTLLTQKLIPKLQKSKAPKKLIINISSVAALLMNPFSSVYSATKAFNRSFSLALTAECAPKGINVLCVDPGFVESQMTKMKPSPICCSAKECVESSLKKIGEIEVLPHWKHTLMYCFASIPSIIVPNCLLPRLSYKSTLSFRKRANPSRI